MEKLFYPELLKSDLQNESDVEQKFVIPLLNSHKPLGLEYSIRDFRTKPDIRALTIDKGTKEKLYYPDYVIIFSGLPMFLIEAKHPNEDVYKGLREARLYANELNSKFKHGINPIQKVISTNGILTLCGNIDADDPFLELTLEDFNACSTKFSQFIDSFNKDVTFQKGKEILRNYRANRQFVKPSGLLGGLTIQNREMPPNTFGGSLSLDFQNLFNPQTKAERAEVVKNAYVGVKRHLKHVEPIDKIIRSTRPLDSDSQIPLFDTEKPKEISSTLTKGGLKLRNQLLLLVGSVGSGKSTFTDYLYEVGLTTEQKEQTEWVVLDMNNAPVNKIEIYSWIKQQIISNLKISYSHVDFDDYEYIKSIYSVEIGAFKKSIGKILNEDSDEYKKLLAQEIIKLKSNIDTELNGMIRLLCQDKGKLLVIVLDNSDKRDLESQLLMFEVANWLKENIKALIFLPLRDTTYDFHKKEKPLDTVIKNLVFRIEPPPLKDVIYQRLKFGLKKLSKGKKTLHYDLPNGFKIDYSESELSFYLVSILRSLFNNVYFSRLISGLAGRDIRKGLEIFLEFCTSGHITEDYIFKIRQSKGDYVMPNYLISRVLFRGNFKYYNEQAALVKNIFHADFLEELPNYFLRLSILRWLENRYKKQGPNKIAGYHKAEDLIRDLVPLGFKESSIIESINFLIKNKTIVTESQSEEEFRENDLISISAGGFVYIDLIKDVNYLAAISEDVLYNENQIAKKIADKISSPNHFHFHTIIENSKVLIDYLDEYQNKYLIYQPKDFIINDENLSLSDLTETKEILSRHIKSTNLDELFELERKHPIGSKEICEIVYKQDYGVFVEFGLEASGFIHISYFNKKNLIMEDFDIGDIIEAEVLEFNKEKKRFNLSIHEV